MKKVVLAVIVMGGLVWLLGKALDAEAERVINQLYVRDSQGVISGLEPITLLRGSSKALVLFHGHMGSPENYAEFVDDIKGRIDADIHVPLLPNHGHNLETAAQLDNRVVIAFIKNYIDDVAKKYQSVTVVGLSYSGAALASLAKQGEIPPNINLVLYAPAIFMYTNTLFFRIQTHVYEWWRDYCNYPLLNCNFPAYGSGDEVARPIMEKEKTLRYIVLPAVMQLCQIDLDNRDSLEAIRRPYHLVTAVDDNRVDFEKQKAACKANQPFCSFHSFPPSKHMIHWGANKPMFENLMVQLSMEFVTPP